MTMRDIAIETPAGRLSGTMREGEGMPLLLWPSIFHDRSLYDGLIGQLANPVVVIDGPGHGASGINPGGLDGPSLARSAGMVASAAFGPRPFVMVGTSWGALVAAELAASQDRLLAGVVLFNPPWTAHPRASLGDRMIALMAHVMPTAMVFRKGVARSFFAPATHSENPGMIAAFLAQATFANPGLAVAVRSVLVDRHRQPMPDPARILVPVAVVSGELDQLYSADIARDMAGRMPSGTHETVAATAHVTAAEDPAASAGIVKRLLARIAVPTEVAA